MLAKLVLVFFGSILIAAIIACAAGPINNILSLFDKEK